MPIPSRPAFEKIVEKIKPEREFSRQPLVQILFNLADTSERHLALPRCDVVNLRRWRWRQNMMSCYLHPISTGKSS